MHRAIATWLTQRSWHAVLAAAFCGAMAPQLPMPFLLLAGAIPVLMVMRGDERLALGAAITASVANVWILLSLAQAANGTAMGIVAVILSTWALASVWQRTRSPNLCFQLAVLGTALAVTLVYLLLDDPAALWIVRLKLLVASMAQAGIVVDGDVDALVQAWARTMWGALGAMTLAAVLIALFLGRWWLSLLQGQGDFGTEFRQLRLGQVLGVGITVLLALALWLDSAWIDSVAWVALAGLAFQGLAAAHRGKATGRLNHGWLAAIYVLLLMPLSTSVTVLVLAIWGFADNWLRPRGRGVDIVGGG